MAIKEWVYSIKKILRIVIDISLFSLSLIVSYKLRLEHHLSPGVQSWFWKSQLPTVLPFVVALRTIFLFVFQIYSKMWRYTEINEILELTKPIVFSSLLLAIPRAIGFTSENYIFAIPFGVIIMDSSLSLIFLSFARLTRKWQIANRAIKKRQQSKIQRTKTRTLLIGAGQAAQELVRKIAQHPELDIEVICALDDDLRKQNIKLSNSVRVTGQINSLDKIVKEQNIEQIIIAIPSMPPKQLREIVELCQKTNLETKIIPGVDQLAGGQVTIEQIRKVSLEDLLGREPVDMSIPEVANFINNKTILITGAGGSIGSELTKQLVKNFSPKHIYILGRGENSIFQLSQDLSALTSNFTPIICDIRNYKQLHYHIHKAAPEVIFHAAAHKHVPLMEDHPKEAFENNAIGTKNIAEIAGLLNTETFVNISTDKAVNPVNVLGFTKRLAELIVNACAKEYPKTKYISVRFGNVIGSRGSVIPIWERQLKNNLQITITDKNAYRFFMTLLEAAQLVIKASAAGKSSEIMVLDMGNEISIYQLAKDFIKLSGYDFDQIKVKVTGLRPGEKLKEELVGYYEGTDITKHKKILVIKSKDTPGNLVKASIDELYNLLPTCDIQTFKNKLSTETHKLNKLESKVPAGV
ncbi:MAG: polysaccharide biosynthesis protein [Candidatus Melainabacteria bacterium]|nr:polysaccharide biosynthesis protein [Candidatus Melainabacteria bacterium]